MQGGIQPNSTAFDEKSIKLDKQVKQICKDLYKKLKDKYPSLNWVFKLDKETRRKYHIGNGCEPDGGIFFWKDKPFFTCEAKKQQNAGNACERWTDNVATLRLINEEISYTTFAHAEQTVNVQVKDEKGNPVKVRNAKGKLVNKKIKVPKPETLERPHELKKFFGKYHLPFKNKGTLYYGKINDFCLNGNTLYYNKEGFDNTYVKETITSNLLKAIEQEMELVNEF